MNLIKKIAKFLLFRLANHSELVRKKLNKEIYRRDLSAYQEIASRAHLENRSVVFSSFLGRSFSDSPKSIYLQMIGDSLYSNWRFVWVFKPVQCKMKILEKRIASVLTKITPDASNFHAYADQLERMEVVQYKSLEYYSIMATAKYWISNSRLPDEVTPREDQVYLQTWHGTPLKRLGSDIAVDKSHPQKDKDELREFYRIEASKWNYVLAQNEYGASTMKSSFELKKLGKEDAVKTIGYPRNDFLSQYKKTDLEGIIKQLSLPKDKKVALYAPTYRDHQHIKGTGYVYDIGCDLGRLQDELGDEWIILFRTHYFVSNHLDLSRYKGFIYDVSDYEDVNDLYIASDMLITDYSSMVFDYSVLERPVMFFMYDLEYYRKNVRGFYMSFDKLPGEVLEAEEDLIDAMKNFDDYQKRTSERRKAFHKEHNLYDDGKSTERALKIIIDEEDLIK